MTKESKFGRHCINIFFSAVLVSCNLNLLAYALGESRTKQNNFDKLEWPSDSGKSGTFYSNIESYTFSEISPIYQFFKDLEGPPISGGEKAFTINQAELGYKYSNFDIAFISRYQNTLNFTNDTAYVFYADKNKVDINNSKDYSIFMDANYIQTDGIRLGYSYGLLDTFKVSSYVSYLQASKLTDGQLWGSLNATDQQEITGDLYLNYTYTDDVFFERELSDIDGEGYSLDIGFTWTPFDRLQIKGDAKDFYNKITWNQQHYTTAEASTNRVQFDNNGFLDVQPALRWREHEVNHFQVLPRRLLGQIRYEYSDKIIPEIKFHRIDRYNTSLIGFNYLSGTNTALSFFYDIIAESIFIGIKSRYVKFGISSESLSYKRSENFYLNFSWIAPIDF